MFFPPPELVVLETAHWVVNQRVGTALPGYLIVGAKDPEAMDLSRLVPAAQAELGPVLARVQAAVTEVLTPEWTLVSRWGLMEGFPVHFHVIPVTRGVIDAYLADERYRGLMAFYTRPPVDDPGEFDGADLTLFVVREFTKRATPPAVSGPSIEETVHRLRTVLGN